jgi:ferredoxin-NADP reductase
MARVEMTLRKREEIAEGTWLFTLAHGRRPFTFVPGQSIDLYLVDPPRPDPRGAVHTFSIAGTAGPEAIQIATRIRNSVYKENLLEMPLGGELEVDGPKGNFTLPPDGDDIVLIAGGIGVTPFRAICEDASARSLDNEIALLHSNRNPEETPFLAQLKRWTTGNARFTYVPTMTGMEESQTPWVGLRRRIDAEFLDDALEDDRNRAFYMVAGQAPFVMAVVGALDEVGVAPERIKREDFPGY